MKQKYFLYIVKLKLDVVHITQLGSFSFSHYLKKIISLQQPFIRPPIINDRFQQTGSKISPAPRNAFQYQTINTNRNKEVNRDNIESAKKIKDDLKRDVVNPMGGLVAYDDSDSD